MSRMLRARVDLRRSYGVCNERLTIPNSDMTSQNKIDNDKTTYLWWHLSSYLDIFFYLAICKNYDNARLEENNLHPMLLNISVCVFVSVLWSMVTIAWDKNSYWGPRVGDVNGNFCISIFIFIFSSLPTSYIPFQVYPHVYFWSIFSPCFHIFPVL